MAITQAGAMTAAGTGETPTAPRDAATSAAASKFEAMMIGQMLQPMFDTIAEDKTFGGGPAEGMLRPMLVTEYANLMEQKGGLGLDDAIGHALAQAPGRR